MARRGENIHKRKDGRWEGRYIKARTPDRRICWGYIYGTTYAEVKQRLIHKKSEYGGFQLIDAHLTFTELAEAWLQSVKCGLKESTCAHYQYTLYKYVLPILGTVPISRLEENILEQALQKIIAPPDGQHKELGFSSARECLSMVRRICKYAVHLRLIRPMELSVRLPQEKSHSMTPLSVVEQNRLRTYVLSNPTPRKLGLLLGIESGLRIGEVCGLKWDDFDLKTGTVQIKRTVSRIPCGDGHTKIVIQTPKTRTSRREIPLSKHMVQALKIFQKSYPSDITNKSGKYIVFCANKEHIDEMISHVPEWFAGVNPDVAVYEAYSDDPGTDKAFTDFKADQGGRLKLLFCIDMLNEGVHVEGISGVILFRPTASPIIYKQQIGRALTAGDSKG